MDPYIWSEAVVGMYPDKEPRVIDWKTDRRHHTPRTLPPAPCIEETLFKDVPTRPSKSMHHGVRPAGSTEQPYVYRFEKSRCRKSSGAGQRGLSAGGDRRLSFTSEFAWKEEPRGPRPRRSSTEHLQDYWLEIGGHKAKKQLLEVSEAGWGGATWNEDTIINESLRRSVTLEPSPSGAQEGSVGRGRAAGGAVWIPWDMEEVTGWGEKPSLKPLEPSRGRQQQELRRGAPLLLTGDRARPPRQWDFPRPAAYYPGLQAQEEEGEGPERETEDDSSDVGAEERLRQRSSGSEASDGKVWDLPSLADLGTPVRSPLGTPVGPGDPPGAELWWMPRSTETAVVDASGRGEEGGRKGGQGEGGASPRTPLSNAPSPTEEEEAGAPRAAAMAPAGRALTPATAAAAARRTRAVEGLAAAAPRSRAVAMEGVAMAVDEILGGAEEEGSWGVDSLTTPPPLPGPPGRVSVPLPWAVGLHESRCRAMGGGGVATGSTGLGPAWEWGGAHAMAHGQPLPGGREGRRAATPLSVLGPRQSAATARDRLGGAVSAPPPPLPHSRSLAGGGGGGGGVGLSPYFQQTHPALSALSAIASSASEPDVGYHYRPHPGRGGGGGGGAGAALDGALAGVVGARLAAKLPPTPSSQLAGGGGGGGGGGAALHMPPSSKARLSTTGGGRRTSGSSSSPLALLPSALLDGGMGTGGRRRSSALSASAPSLPPEGAGVGAGAGAGALATLLQRPPAARRGGVAAGKAAAGSAASHVAYARVRREGCGAGGALYKGANAVGRGPRYPPVQHHRYARSGGAAGGGSGEGIFTVRELPLYPT